MTKDSTRLEVRGEIRAGACSWSKDELAALPASAQVADVGALVPGRRGTAIRLVALLDAAGPAQSARFVNIESRDPAFAVSVPLGELASAVVIYAEGGAPLAPEKGGPFRLLVPGHDDECVNVKQVVRLELARERGRDTRPIDDDEHRKLHACKRT
ncbi:MAG: molybdopterin-dependent oxidoreductase [Planctomycetota bacterium]